MKKLWFVVLLLCVPTLADAAILNWVNGTDAVGVTGATILRCTGAACTPSIALNTVSASNGSAGTYTDLTATGAGTTYGFAVWDNDAAGNHSPQTATVYITIATTSRRTLATEDFARIDNIDLGSAWDDAYNAPFGPCKIVSQRYLPTTVNTECHESYNGVSTPNDQWAQITLSILTGAQDSTFGVNVRMKNSPTREWYSCQAEINNGSVKSVIVRYNAVGVTVVASENVTVWGVGDKIRCEAQGTDIRLYRLPAAGGDVLLLSGVDATYASGKAGVFAWMATGGTLTNVQGDDFAMGDFSSVTGGDISFDAVSTSSVVQTNTTSWSHTVGAGNNRVFEVCTVARGADANVPVSGVTLGGVAMTKIRNDTISIGGGVSMSAELWRFTNPTAGTQTVAVTWTGAMTGGYGAGTGISLFGVDQASPYDANGGATDNTLNLSGPITTVANNAWIVGCALARDEPMTSTGAQTVRSQRNVTGALTDVMGVTTELKATAGAETTTWTQNDIAQWAISNSSLKPATTTPPVEPPTIVGLTLDATGADLTYGTTTPTSIRVAEFTNTATIASVIYPISSFPAGRYTQTWRDGLDGVCFHPLDSIGVENTLTTAYRCGSLVGIVDPLDVTPPVLSNPVPTTDLPFGTTSTIMSVTLDKPAQCHYDTSDVAYDSMANTMTTASLVASATISSLTDDSTTTEYVRCQSVDALDGVHPNLTSQVITIHVLAAPAADTTRPTDVTNLVATAQSTVATLVWSAATDAGGIAGYQVYQSTDACVTPQLAGNPVPTTTVQVNLGPSTAYCWTVKAIDTSNNLSLNHSNTASVTTGPIIDVTPPSAMMNLHVIGEFTQSILLGWDTGTDDRGSVTSSIEQCLVVAPSTDCSDFTVVRSLIAVQNLNVALTATNTYCFRGFHSDAAGNTGAYSNTVCGTTLTAGITQPRVPVPLGARDAASRSAAGTRVPRP